MTGERAGGLAPTIHEEWVRELIERVGLEVRLADFDTPEGDHVSGRATEEQAVAWLNNQLDAISQSHWALRGRFASSSKEAMMLADEISILLRRALTKMGYDPGRAESLIDPRLVHAGLPGLVPRDAGIGYERINASVSAVADLQLRFEQLARLLEDDPAELRQSRADEWDQRLRDRLAACYRQVWRREAEFSRNSHTNELQGPFLRFMEPTLEIISGRPRSPEGIYKAFRRQRGPRVW